MSERRKVFLSVTGMLKEIRAGQVSSADLSRGLFFIAANRERLLEPEDGDLPREFAGVFARNLTKGEEVFSQVKEALELAETEGRILWRSDNGVPVREQLNGLLQKHGHQPVGNIPPLSNLAIVASAVKRADHRLQPVH